MEEILKSVLEYAEIITAIVGLVAGWLGKRQKDKIQEKKVVKQLKSDHGIDLEAMSRLIDRKVEEINQMSKFQNDN